MTRGVLLGLIVAACGALAIGLFGLGLTAWGAAALGGGAVWVVFEARRNGQLAGLAFMAVVGGAAALTLQGGPVGLALAAVVAGLGAWDLSRFQARLSEYPLAPSFAAVERAHFRRLGLALGVGLPLALAGLGARVQLPFWAVFGAAAATLALLFGVLRGLRRRSDD